MAVSKRLRFEILRRDDFRCRYCGKVATESELHVDHVIPTTLGGTDEPGNLVCACKDCNAGKSSVPADAPLVESVEADALRWAAAMQRAAEIHRAERAKKVEATEPFIERWNDWTYGHDQKPVPIEGKWRQSIEQFLDAGLAMEDMVELVDVAMNSKCAPKATWRYFCGCCWRRVKERQEVARSLIEADED